MIEQPLVTVITVVFNIIENGRKDFLIQNFESVHNQTYKNIEHLVVDGASTDGTIDLLKKYEGKGWIRYISGHDNGPYDAMNKGIKNARGEYIILLHSDDYFYNDSAIKIQMKYLIQSNADYTIGNTIFIDNRGSEILPSGHIPARYDKNFLFQKGDNVHTFWQDIPFNHEGNIVRKSVFKEIGFFDEQKTYGVAVDYKFEIDLILNDFKYTYIPYSLICFRLDGISSNLDESDSIKFCNILKYLYSKFYSINVSDILSYNTLREKPNDFFLFELKMYLESKNLKNFDYSAFYSFLEKVQQTSYRKEKSHNKNLFSEKTNYFFLGLPLMKVKMDSKGNKHFKLFFFLPIFKIKHDSKGGKTYKLFSFLPVFKIKKK